MTDRDEQVTYAASGVDIDAGNEAVRRIIGHTRRTFRPGVLGDIGGFGGLFALETSKFKNPVLVSGTDGVGTKLRIAFLMNKHDTIGQDAVAMCVNDIIVQGAEPLFFLDYLAVGKLDPARVEAIVKGVADGCELAGCALLGGETAEMPGFYPEDEYDLAGFSVGAVDRDRLVDGSGIRPGDAVVGLASTGLHSNGYSLARKVFFDVARLKVDDQVLDLGQSLGEELLTPTRIYVKSILSLMEKHCLLGMAHITGGGLIENIPRVLPSGCKVRLEWGSWPVLPVFRVIKALGRVDETEMERAFNLGLGMVLIVRPEEASSVVETARALGEKPYLVGEVVEGPPSVEIIGGGGW